jgi:molecular chaperone GrpE
MILRIFHHPSDPEGPSLDPGNEVKDEETLELPEAEVDPLEKLQADLEAAKAGAADWQDRFLRKAAEFENYRKRVQKESSDSVIQAKGSVLKEILPVADACERALESINQTRNENDGLDRYHEGIELLYKQVLDALEHTGVVPFEARGKKFDPHLHEALIREESSNYEDDTVIEELRKGYLFKDKLLRPAQVKVAVRPQNQDKIQ